VRSARFVLGTRKIYFSVHQHLCPIARCRCHELPSPIVGRPARARHRGRDNAESPATTKKSSIQAIPYGSRPRNYNLRPPSHFHGSNAPTIVKIGPKLRICIADRHSRGLYFICIDIDVSAPGAQATSPHKATLELRHMFATS